MTPASRAVPPVRWLCPAVPILAWSLAGCAAAPGATATCTDLISTGGGLLRYCQSGDKLNVSESGIDPARAATDVRIVDDPAVLRALQRQIVPSPSFKASRSIIARACVVKGGDFVSVSLSDLKRIIDTPVRARSVAAGAGGDG